PPSAKVPDKLSNIVYRCLEKDPAHRYNSVYDLAQDLRSFIDGLGTVAGARRQGRKRMPVKRPKILQVAILSAAFAIGMVVVPPSRAWLIKQCLPWSPSAGITAVLNQRLLEALKQTGNSTSLVEAATMEMSAAEADKNANRKAEHFQSAAS